MTYVYPVVSRRSGGVSVGINLNPNNACNWRCVYCQVPELTFGNGPDLDPEQLATELMALLSDIQDGDFMRARVPEDARVLKDVAFSGNGEPTTSPQFVEAIEVVVSVLTERKLGGLPIVLISNGSMVGKPRVQAGLRLLAAHNGRVWFKLDAATSDGAARINHFRGDIKQHLDRLRTAAQLCPTWVQTCMFAWQGREPSAEDVDAYLAALEAASKAAELRGVLLYGLARPSQQPEAAELSALPPAWLEALGERIRELGLPVKVSS